MSYNGYALFSYWIGTQNTEKFKEQACACCGAANTGVRALRGIDRVSHPRLEVIKFCRYPRSVVGRWNWKVCMQECWSAKIEPKNSGFTYLAQGLKAFIQDVYLVYSSFLGSLPFKVVWRMSHQHGLEVQRRPSCQQIQTKGGWTAQKPCSLYDLCHLHSPATPGRFYLRLFFSSCGTSWLYN